MIYSDAAQTAPPTVASATLAAARTQIAGEPNHLVRPLGERRHN
jgi:hypothetical protein